MVQKEKEVSGSKAKQKAKDKEEAAEKRMNTRKTTQEYKSGTNKEKDDKSDDADASGSK
jgi:hypothetical protein